MDQDSNDRKWDELMPDALGLIFKHLSLKEVLTVIPGVCKSWDNVVKGPYCWREIDIEEWCTRKLPECVDRMLHMLIPRSCGSLRKLCVSGVHNDATVAFIAEHADCLDTLHLPRSNFSDSILEQSAERFSRITFLDVSHCTNIGAGALEAIGKNCKLLTGLCRNLNPYDILMSQDYEAQIISNTMPRLRHLELAYNCISSKSVMEILSSCSDLEILDLMGCWKVNIDFDLLKAKYPKVNVLGHDIEDTDSYFWDYYSMLKGIRSWL